MGGLKIAILVVVVAVLGFVAGVAMGSTPEPVCYSSTEDSKIVGCDYDDGRWYPKPGWDRGSEQS